MSLFIYNFLSLLTSCVDVTELSSRFLMWVAENLDGNSSRGQASAIVVLWANFSKLISGHAHLFRNNAYIDGLATKIALRSHLKVAACHRHADTPDLSLNQVIVCSVDASRLVFVLLTIFTNLSTDIAQSRFPRDMDNFAFLRLCDNRCSLGFTGGFALNRCLGVVLPQSEHIHKAQNHCIQFTYQWS